MSNTVVRTNVRALNAHRNLTNVANQQMRASQRLSSGLRINSAADDAAGLAISEGMRAQIRGMTQAMRNAQDGISLLQTAEGYMQTVTELLQRTRELAVQGANDTYNEDQRSHINNEMEQLAQEITRIFDSATFNGQRLFCDGSQGGLFTDGDLNLQVGPDGNHPSQAINVNTAIDVHINNVLNYVFGEVDNLHGHETHEEFNQAIEDITDMFTHIVGFRSGLGTLQNRLEFTIQHLDIAIENLSAAESRIRDADMAAEMMKLAQANILMQASTFILAQANQAPQMVLQLLG